MTDHEKLAYFNPATFAADAKVALEAIQNRPSDPHNVHIPPNPGANYYLQPQEPGRNPYLYVPPATKPVAPKTPAEASRNGRARRGEL